MSGMLLFESLQFLEEDLLEECEEAQARPRPILRWGSLAACCILAAGAALLLPRVLRTQPLPDSGCLSAVTASPAGSGEAALPQGVTGTRPGEAAEATPAPPPPGPAAEPDPLYWNDLEELPSGGGSAWFLLVGEALTEAELSACAPPRREQWWLKGCEGYATYIGAEGGTLAWVTLLASAEGLEDPIQVTLRDVNAPAPPQIPGIPGPEEAHTGLLNDQEYRAFRNYYEDGTGEKRVWLAAVFEKEGVEYTLTADVPEAQEKTAGMDLHWLIVDYSEIPAPDLSGFRYGEHPAEGE